MTVDNPHEATLIAFFRCPVCGDSLLDCVPAGASDGDEVICPDGDRTGKSVREWRERLILVTPSIAAALQDD